MTEPLHKHLPHLKEVWAERPIYFITVCAFHRGRFLIEGPAPEILINAWRDSLRVHGWQIGRYVVMPDHAHFFCAPFEERKTLSKFIQDWKKWTARQMKISMGLNLPHVWQAEFFDHLLRSDESYSQKWEYVRQNPVRAGLVAKPGQWEHQGEIEVLL